MKELYEAEDVDPIWAPEVEQHIRVELLSAFETLLDGTIEDFDVECRTASCMVTYTVEPSEMERAFAFQQWLPFADAMQPWHEPIDEETGRNRLGMRLSFFGDRDIRVLIRRFQAEFAKRFSKGLAAVRDAVDEHGLGGVPK